MSDPVPSSYSPYSAEESALLIEAVHTDRLAALDHPDAVEVCRLIGKRVADEVNAAVSRLVEAGIEATVDGNPGEGAQRHHATIVVGGAGEALRAARVLAGGGYRPWEPIDGPAEPILRRFRQSLTVARTDDVTMVIGLRWPPSRLASSTPGGLVPNENDYDAVSLPAGLWPLHFVFRPIRLAAERLGLRPRSSHTLGPFLSTPADLIGPLLDLAGVDRSDTLVDLGCGDGRVLRQAVGTRGCRGVGIESNPALVAEARRLVRTEQLDGLVTIVEGDAAAEELPAEAADATVFFLFVPAYAVPTVAERLLSRARPGARLIVHEQHPLPEPLAASRFASVDSVPILAGQGVTVAHRISISSEVGAGHADPADPSP